MPEENQSSEEEGGGVKQDGEREPYPIVDPDYVQATSAAVGVAGVALLTSGASGGTADAALGLMGVPETLVQGALTTFGITGHGSLTLGIAVTIVGVALNLLSLALRYFRSRTPKTVRT